MSSEVEPRDREYQWADEQVTALFEAAVERLTTPDLSAP
jgi:hypothetical protein